MSRLTGTDALGLFEAYQTVYAPQQELTEEQVWEEVETWVNSLIEEGYDLSEYTWEEMYESYLNEAIGQPGSAGMVNWKDKGTGAVRSGYKSSSDGKLYRNYNDALAARNSRLRTLAAAQQANRELGRGFTMPGAPDPPAAPARPAVTAPAGAPTRPAAGAPKQTAATPATTTPSPRVKDTSITDMIGRSQIRQGAPINTGNLTSDARSIAIRSSVGAATQPASTPKPASPVNKATGSKKPGSIVSGFDMFDVVMGHLLDEGYADTQEAALVIMANMSEEWKQSIVEGVVDSATMSSDQRRRKRNDEYRSENPTLPSGNPMGPNAQLMR